MKDYIKKLAGGEFEYRIPVLEIPGELTGDVVEDSKGMGSLDIRADGNITGTSYSQNTRFKTGGSFSGKDIKLNYTVDAGGMRSGERIEGELVIVSSAGEKRIPYSFDVIKKAVYAGNIKVEDLRSFTVLAMRDPQEALKIFEAPEFRAVVLRDNAILNALYDRLMPSEDAGTAMDSFLESSGALEDRRDELITDGQGTGKDGYGESAGNAYPDGNRSAVGLQTDAKTALRAAKGSTSPFNRLWKRIKAELFRGYLDFRMKKISLEDWCRKALLRVNDENFLMLYKKTEEEARSYLELQVATAMLLSFAGDTKEAHKVLNACGSELMEDKKRNGVLYYTALYITTMINSSDENLTFTKTKLFEATETPEMPWQVVLFRYHMDPDSDENASIWLTRFKDVFSKGCNSPIIYLEAIRIINNQPVLLRVLNSFETQVIRFGYRYGLVEPAASSRVTELVSEEKKPEKAHLQCLKKLYDEYNSDEILETLCKKMIQGNLTGPEYAPVYEQAIKRGLNITRLYEYFLMSLDKTKQRTLPERVLRYFAYDSGIDHASRAYLYANVIHLKEKDPEVYALYEDNMIAFAADRLAGGHIDENLAGLYRWLWDNDTELARRFPLQVFRLQNTYRITVKSDAVTFTDITHPEFNTVKKAPVKERRTFAFILNNKERVQDSCVICFEDARGRLYNENAFEYKIERVLGSRRPVMIDSAECESDAFYLLYAYRRARHINDEETAKELAKKLIAGHRDILSKAFGDELKLFAYGDLETAETKAAGPEVTAIKGDRKDITDLEDLLSRMLFTKQGPEATAPVFAQYYALKKQGVLVEAYCAYQSFLYFVCGEHADMQVIPIIYERVSRGGKALPVELATLLCYGGTGEREFTAEQKDIYEGIIKAFVSKGYIFSFFRELSSRLDQPVFIQDKTVAEFRSEPGREVVFVFTDGRLAGRRIRGRETFNGIYVCELVLFYGETLHYNVEVDGVDVYYNGETADKTGSYAGAFEITAAQEPYDKSLELCRINEILKEGGNAEALTKLGQLEAELKAAEREFAFV